MWHDIGDATEIRGLDKENEDNKREKREKKGK